MSLKQRHRTNEIFVSYETRQLLRWYLEAIGSPDGVTIDAVADSMLHEVLLQRPELRKLHERRKEMDKAWEDEKAATLAKKEERP